jgi:hypothetical protein
MKDKCVKCEGNVHILDEEIEKEIKRVMDSGVPITKQDEYELRLKACSACNHLIYGTTCMSCGCIVRVRALNALRICPHASGSKW